MASNEASFAVEIAASMSGGDHTLAQLDALTDKLMGGGKGADFFSDAINKVSRDLDGAKAATVAANDALSEGESHYRALEKAADRAAKAAERAAQKGAGIPEDLATRAREAGEALNAHTAKLHALEVEAARANAEETKLVSTLGNLKKLNSHVDKSLSGQVQAIGGLRESVGKLSPALGGVANKVLGPIEGFKKLTAEVGASKAAALALAVCAGAVALGLGALAFGAAKSFAKLTASVIRLSDREGKLDAATDRIEASISKLFGGLNIDPVVAALDRIAGLFDATSASGRALQFLFESIWQPLIDQSDRAADIIQAVVLGIEIAAVKAYIAAQPLIKAFKDFFGIEDRKTSDSLLGITRAAEYAVPIVLGLTAAIGVALLGATVAATAALAPFIAAGLAMVAPFAAGAAAVAGVGAAVYQAYKLIQEVDFGELGTALIDGFVGGIMGGASRVINAITGLAHGAIDSAKKVLGIASPSKVFAEIGEFTGEGFEKGVDDSSDLAASALSRMVSPSAVTDTSARGTDGGASAGGAAGARSITVTGNTFQFMGCENAEGAARGFKEQLIRLLEGETA